MLGRDGGDFGGKRHGPRTRKRDPRKLKGGTAVLLCLKRQFAGLRYGLYITAATATADDGGGGGDDGGGGGGGR